jgi:hypothetical protein
MARRLRRLQEAFESLDDNTEDVATLDKSGDERMAAALRRFGANWYDRRAEMARLMSDLAALADQAATAYVETDRGAAPSAH